jgi:hypothetical protein
MNAFLYPKKYVEASNSFNKDVAETKRNQFEVSYSIFYGQTTNSIILDITDNLPEQVLIEIKESFNRNFKLFHFKTINLICT